MSVGGTCPGRNLAGGRVRRLCAKGPRGRGNEPAPPRRRPSHGPQRRRLLRPDHRRRAPLLRRQLPLRLLPERAEDARGGTRCAHRPRRRPRPRRERQGSSRRRVRSRRAGAPDGLPSRLPRHRREHQPRASATGHCAGRRAGPLRTRHPPPSRRARARLPRCLLRRGRVPRGCGRHLRHRGRQGAPRRRALPRPPGGGRVGFSDLAFREDVSAAQDREVRAVLYHSAAELVTDWPALFRAQGFRIDTSRDILVETLPTWEHVSAEYRRRNGEVLHRYGRRLAARTSGHLEQIRGILAAHGTYPAFAACKP